MQEVPVLCFANSAWGSEQQQDPYIHVLMANGRFMITKSVNKGANSELFKGFDN